MLKFNSVPTEKPKTEFPKLNPGRYDADFDSAEYRVGPKGPYLLIKFKEVVSGTFISGFFSLENDFGQYCLGRLANACQMTLPEECTADELVKLISQCVTRVSLDVVLNDSGYANIDFSGNLEGIYPFEFLPENMQQGPSTSSDSEF